MSPFAAFRIVRAKSGCDRGPAGAHLALRHGHLLHPLARVEAASGAANANWAAVARHKMSRTGGDLRLA
jgi:hypothetical protein